ncbi:hypothetical protein TanjilG_26196 [Lupinus angustifolius]|uniref:glycerophosphodiester phosphodiesterase n=1 Tax=Lupinus angustifolius TaxID=3871 RepID=A0A4P1R2Z2_LUPAN|nr:hypothetical protein TanjilG_26196 [Lupinus angustifolius]
MMRSLCLFSLLLHATMAQKPAIPNKPVVAPQVPAATPVQKWPTLSGNEPLVIARGGFTGLFPEGSPDAIGLSKDISTFLCNLQLTKDAGAYCLTGTTLDNSTTIALFDPKENTYNINGKDVRGHFSLDYTSAQIDQNVSVNQAIFSRPEFFDGVSPVLNVDALLEDKAPPKFWLNVQSEAFYSQHGLKVVDIVLEILKVYPIDFVSSSEISFLKSINGKSNKATKVIFQLLHATDVESTTIKPYGEIVKDLLNIKSFASGIMVPKEYIWPVKPDKYLGLPTTLVADAHKLGLEVYASGFANDFFSSYNYSYDPTAEYLQFIDKEVSVDGVVTDFPVTASNAIACFAHNNTLPQKGPTWIISNNGASGVYPGSTDLAYNQAIADGVDIIDCSVQMTKDGVAFCTNSIDLIGTTTAMTKFMSRSSLVPELQAKSGIFSFDLTWSEIQTLKPQIVNTQSDLPRNPAEKNSGKFVTLPEFLELAKAKAVAGILVNISNAAYLASKKGLDIVGVVSTALSNATFDKQSTQQVLIQSDDSSVLSKFKDIPSYKRVLIIATTASVLLGITNVVKELKDANLTVFIRTLRNEYMSLAFDYWSDPTFEIATYVQTTRVDGLVTDHPATASRYLRSPCSDPKHVPTILPAQPGELLSTIPAELLPPSAAPLPPLEVADVVDPPLPAVVNTTKDVHAAAPAAPVAPSSTASANSSNVALSLVAILVFAMLSARH